MKNIIKLSLVFVLFFVSCSDSFIELAPISEGNADNFYKTPADFEAAIIGAYSNLASDNQYGSSDTRFGGSFSNFLIGCILSHIILICTKSTKKAPSMKFVVLFVS